MGYVLETEAFLDVICQLLEQGQTDVAIPVAGSSMVPFLHDGDTVCLNLVDSPLKRGDILLYQRENGRYILHRLWRVRPDGSLLMVGDAQQELELRPRRELVRARVSFARHKGKIYSPRSFRWWLYRHVWMWLRPVRHRLMRLRGWFR